MQINVRVVGANGKRRPTFEKEENFSNFKIASLTSDYVHELSQRISLRIRQRDSLHANSEELAAKAKFR